MTVLLLFAACSTPSRELFVDLRTDLVPVAEWRFLEIELAGGTVETVVATGSEDWVRGERVAHFVDAPELSDVTLRFYDDATRSLLLQRRVAVRVSGTTASTVTVTRSCVGVMCPRGSDARDATECVGGICNPPECVTGEEPTCDGECSRDDQCVVSQPCVRGVCRARACLQEPVAGACNAGEFCDPMRGCRPLPMTDAGAGDAELPDVGSPDAGTDTGPPDAGPPDTGPPDAGPPDMGPPPCVPPASVSGVLADTDPRFDRPRDETGGNLCDTDRTTISAYHDAHTFTNTCGTPLTCTFDLIGDLRMPGWLQDPFLTMYAGSSVPADTLVALGCDDDGGTGTNARLSRTIMPGESVTLAVTAWNNDPMIFGRYELEVSCP